MSETKSKEAPKRPRPLSPHLQVYRLPLAALMSISHRASGIWLSVGFMALAIWLWAGATHASCFDCMQSAFASPVGVIAIALWVAAFFYHLSSGIRHMIWDTVNGLEKPSYTFTNWVVLGAAAVMTLCTYFKLYPFFAKAFGI